MQLFTCDNARVLGDKHTYHLTHPVTRYEGGDFGGDGAPIVPAPMPGKVVRVMVKEGDEVQEGQPLLILEAMKMEHTLTAKRAGVVESVPYAEGVLVEAGAALVVLADDVQK